MIQHQIVYKKYRYITVRVLKNTNKEDSYDVMFQSSAWPRWRRWHKNVDIYVMKELVFIYKFRAWLLQFTTPRVSHWIITGR
jgi:hypothetical protein